MSLQESIDAVTVTLEKVFIEVTSASAALQTEIAALQAQINAGLTVDISGLQAISDRLDAINPDTPSV